MEFVNWFGMVQTAFSLLWPMALWPAPWAFKPPKIFAINYFSTDLSQSWYGCLQLRILTGSMFFKYTRSIKLAGKQSIRWQNRDERGCQDWTLIRWVQTSMPKGELRAKSMWSDLKNISPTWVGKYRYFKTKKQKTEGLSQGWFKFFFNHCYSNTKKHKITYKLLMIRARLQL